ncbi:MAG TPA: Ig-like domain-containing protein [Acidimicrobiales bacterium]|nr:Ig-like domain-containing protein [Acidimicrobiales bacterium]
MRGRAAARGGHSRDRGFGRGTTAVFLVGVLVVAALVAVAVVGGLSTGTGQASGGARSVSATTAPPSTTTTTSRAQALAQLLADVTVSPPDGSERQSLSTVVNVRAIGARLGRVEVTGLPNGPLLAGTGSPNGSPLAGTFDAAASEWHSTAALLPGTTYVVSFEVVGADGLSAQGSSTFTTIAPLPVLASVFPTPGITVGIGQPVVVTFSQPVETLAAQQAVLSRFTVRMSRPVPGGWHWFNSWELHFRPVSYWPVGEQVRLSGDLDYWHVSGREWGQGQVSTNFVIGDSHISTVNLLTHRMTVTDDGRVVYVFPISGGRPEYPTMNGTHIVLDRESVVHMVSSTVGIPVHSPNGYDEYVHWDVHISDSGEYVHAAPWSVTDQGFINVSHGCVNLSPDRAEAFFHFSRVGDIVDVIGSPRAPVFGDHGVMDWSFGSDVVWTSAKVAPISAPVTPSATTAPATTAPATTAPATTAPATTGTTVTPASA